MITYLTDVSRTGIDTRKLTVRRGRAHTRFEFERIDSPKRDTAGEPLSAVMWRDDPADSFPGEEEVLSGLNAAARKVIDGERLSLPVDVTTLVEE